MSYPINPREELFLTVKKSKKRPAKCDFLVADPGEGPPLFLDQTKCRKAKFFFFLRPPPLSQAVWMTAPRLRPLI